MFETRPNLLFTAPSRRFQAVPEEPGADKFLDCAVAAGASCIVSDATHLLRLGAFQGVSIVTPAAFVTLLGVAENQTPYQRVKHLLGSVDSGIPDLGTRHREHLADRFRSRPADRR